MPRPLTPEYLSAAISILSADSVERAGSGHPGMPLGMADSVSVLFREFLRFDPDNPDWSDRDRFVLSAGHGSMLLYSVLYLCGVKGVELSSLRDFRQWGSAAAGHPERGAMAGIETTTGPLGQGLANAVGMALCERLLNARFGDDLVNHHTWVVAGDGCLMEGISQEAITFAGHLQLSRLCVLFDDNGITIDGERGLSDSTDQCARFRASGWRAESIDGHNTEEIRAALGRARDSTCPTLICCRTQIGRGTLTKVGKASSHGAPLGAEEIAHLRKTLDWQLPPFEFEDDLLSRWRSDARGRQSEFSAWQARFSAEPRDRKKAFELAFTTSALAREQKAESSLSSLKEQWLEELPALASRQSSQRVLDVLRETFAGHLLGGSADLTGSNGTKAKGMTVVTGGGVTGAGVTGAGVTGERVTGATEDRDFANGFSGDYLHYGVREHAMAAIMNGISLHGGFIVYGGTFLVFSDYCRPALRLAALMGLRVVHVMTHDSIALGEDGPTHQPIEQLASLRAIPGLYVFRPCDSIEVLECWSIALGLQAPSVLALSRQKLDAVRGSADCATDCATDCAGGYVSENDTNLSRYGAYIVSDGGVARDDEDMDSVSRLLASGSEVSLALDTARLLRARGLSIIVVSFVCWELFEQQSAIYRAKILGGTSLAASNKRIAIEAASPFGWHRYTHNEDHIIGITSFGASAPGDVMLEKFGFSAEQLAERVATLLQ